MNMFIKVLWWINAFVVVWAMVGYPLFLIVLDKILKSPPIAKDIEYTPTVAVLVVAHNEEKVIKKKLENLLTVDYPSEKYSIMITSDFSTDATNSIVEEFIAKHSESKIDLHKTINHGGKTNAQNEAVRLLNSELVIMTDANCYFDKKAVREIASCFKNESVKYVCGKTVFTNSDTNRTADSENIYWDMDSRCRDIESRIQTITAGDGNLYACRTNEYVDVPLIECHDSSFPVLFALKGGRALYDPSAKAYEKAGENDKDEYKRKVRMNRNLFHNILPSFKILNIFKYKWLTIFWIGHRSCRYLLWIAHLLLLVISAILSPSNVFWMITFVAQVLFYIVAIVGTISKSSNKFVKLASYYSITVISQWHGAFNVISGKSKPTWSKAETTR